MHRSPRLHRLSGYKMQLRSYQTDATNAAIDWIKGCIDPIVIGAPTGAGKSHIIAALSKEIRYMSGKRVLVLAPTGELVTQDYQKYLLTGERASIFSASGGRKETIHPVVFGSPLTVANNLLRFDQRYAAIIVDEAHGITPTLIKIIQSMQSHNPNLRIIGLSATPYRLGTGYIYQNHFVHGRMSEDVARDPFFHSLVFDIDARLLIDEGYLTPPAMEQSDGYDTSELILKPNGLWDSSTVDAAFEGHGRKTAGIVGDIVSKATHRKGVMIFAATIKHAQEVMASLPPHLSELVTGKTPKAERADILERFKAKEIKYLVNVSVLTTGFDAPHVDVIAILRATESVALLQQIIGRGLRIDDGKTDCLVLDYAENIERHCPGGDIFDPTIRAKPATASEPSPIECPECHYVNLFSNRKNDENYQVDRFGYFIDPLGQRVDTEHGPAPSHYGRRCNGESLRDGKHDRCDYKWTFKECECGHENDIAARYCSKCKGELVNPNDKLKEIAAKIARDPYRTRTANIINWSVQRWPGKNDKPDTLRVRYEIDESPREISQWFAPETSSAWAQSKWLQFSMDLWGERLPDVQAAIDNFSDARTPTEIVYRKNKGSRFFDIVGVK